MLPVIFFMSNLFANYFDTIEYQEVCYIIQYIVYKNVDSKHFADKKLKFDIKEIHKNLINLINEYNENVISVVHSKNENLKDKLVKFVDDHFVDEDELLSIPFLKQIELPEFIKNLDHKIKDLFENVHKLWYKYARKDAENDDGFYTLDPKSGNSIMDKIPYKKDNTSISNKIHLPNTYFVPGGRFRELYYWDCNWILLGLLSSNMKDFSFDLVLSLTYLIDRYGYVPNGSRKYYLGRSQPPMYGQMLFRLYKENIQREWILSKGLETLEREYTWWMNNRSFDEGLRLNRYKIKDTNYPRPESFKEDFYLKDKYPDLWSGAESGWDFSTRWFNKDKLGEIFTGDIIPVDLNVYLLIVENIIKKFYEIKLNEDEKKINGDDYEKESNKESNKQNKKLDLDKKLNIGDHDKFNKTDLKNTINNSNLLDLDIKHKKINKEDIKINKKDIKIYKNKIKKYSSYILQREEDINKILWNKDKKIWNDYNTKEKTFTDKSFYFSNITPLFAKINIPENLNIYDILYKYKKELFGYPGGIPASGSDDGGGQQWDFPNVWAPLVQMFTEYIYEIEPEMGIHVAKSFFDSVYKGMGANKQFHEKYDCQNVGINGKGGEYNPQEGFGWTNGTISWMIKIFKNELIKDVKHDESYKKICEILENKKSNK